MENPLFTRWLIARYIRLFWMDCYGADWQKRMAAVVMRRQWIDTDNGPQVLVKPTASFDECMAAAQSQFRKTTERQR